MALLSDDDVFGASNKGLMSDADVFGDPAAKPKKQNKGIMGDIGTGLKRGVEQMPGMATGLADLAAAPVSAVTGVNRPFSRAADYLGEKTGFQPGKWAEQAAQEYSPEMQQSLRKVQEADGFTGTLGAIAENPRSAVNLVAESLPSTLAGGILARGAMGAVTGVEKLAALRAAAAGGDAAAKSALMKAGAIAGGVGEGAVTAGQQMAQTDYEVDPLRAAGSAAAAGIGTGIIGGISGRVANKIGLADIEGSIASGTLGAGKKAGKAAYAGRIAGGALQEGALEEMPQSAQEQVWQNIANSKPWDEDVGKASAQGLVAGMAMGAGVNAIPGSKYVESKANPPTEEQQPIVGLLPAPNYTGTPGDQLIANDTERQAAIDAADANAAAVYAAREAFESRLRQSVTIINEPAPLQQRIDEMLAINASAMSKSERARYEKDLAAAFSEPIGIRHDASQREVPFTIGEYLDAQIAAENAVRARPLKQNANQQADTRPQQLADEEQQAGIMAPSIPVVGTLSKVANMAIQSGAAMQTPTGIMSAIRTATTGAQNNGPIATQAAAQVATPGAQVTGGQLPGSASLSPLAPAGNATGAGNGAEVATPGLRPAVSAGIAGGQAANAVSNSATVPALNAQNSVNSPATTEQSSGVRPASADTALQNRDRGRAASVNQMQSIARNPDYMRLGPSRTPDSGAPMVFAVGGNTNKIQPSSFGANDIAVMSDGQRVPFRYAVVDARSVEPSNFADGATNPAFDSEAPGTLKALNNGRTAGVRAAHEAGSSANYTAELLADQAHGVSPAAIRSTPNPMLVRVYAEQANTGDMAAKSQGQGLGMSASERAAQDAEQMTGDVLDKFAPGDIASAGNRDFVRAFVGKLAENELADMMDATGNLSQDGRRRIEAALLTAAYGKSDLVQELFESTDTDIKAIGNALKVLSGQWASMRNAAKDGTIDPDTDMTANLMEAVNIVRRSRAEGSSIAELAGQGDLMGGNYLNELSELFLRIFYKGKNYDRARGGDKVIAALHDVVTSAMNTKAEAGLFGDSFKATPKQIVESARSKIDEENKPASQAALFGANGQVAAVSQGNRSEGTAQPGQVGSRPVGTGRSQEAGKQAEPVVAPKKGDRFTDGEGKTWEVWNARSSLIEAHPVVDGKLVVNRDSGQRFATDARAKSANPEARTDFNPAAKAAEQSPADLSKNPQKLDTSAEPVKETAKSVQDATVDAKKQEESKSAVEKAASEKSINDFGENLGGARKDMEAELRKEWTDDEIAQSPLSKVWPKADVNAIEDTYVAAFAHTARAEIPAKPRVAYKVDRWVQQVKLLRGLTQKVASGSVSKERINTELQKSRLLQHFATKVSLLEALDRKNWDRIGEVAEYPDAYRYSPDGKEKIPTPMVSVRIDGKTTNYNGKALGDVLDKVRADLGDAAPEQRMQFEVRGRVGAYFINKKGDPLYRKLKKFDTSKEAIDYRDSNYAELASAWEAIKNSDNVKEKDVRGDDNRPRAGKDRRDGKDVTPQQFTDDLGFRGVEFGNWVGQGANAKERQGMLNLAYDALMDLADIVGIPPKAISLNGTMGLGFGSRGHGWASAHFEPGNMVINLTKTRGAGSLAHEWFHALDNYFQKARGQQNNKYGSFITFDPENYYVGPNGFKLPERAYKVMINGERHPDFGTIASRYRDPAQWRLVEGVRPEVGVAFADLVKSLNDSPMAKRASLIDKGKSGGYWSRIIERAARSFENYVIAKMAQNGYHNDYLANVTAVEGFARDKGRYPYLMPEEVAPVAEAFDNLFATLETKETDKGIALHEESAVYTVNEQDGISGDLFQGTDDALPAAARKDSLRPKPVAAGNGAGSRAVLAVREAPDSEGVYYIQSQLVTVGERSLPVGRINTPEDAARAFAGLSRFAVEHLDGLVTDKAGKPLAIIGGFKGAPTQAQAYPSTLMMELSRIDGAANLWLSHNHPSGVAALSRADENLSSVFGRMLEGSSVTYRGLSAMARNGKSVQWADTDYNHGEVAFGEPSPHPVPIVERELIENNPGSAINSPAEAKRLVAEIAKGKPGIVFVTAQNQIASFVPFAPEEMGKLRSGDRLMRLFRAAAKSGGAGAFVAMPDGMVNAAQYANLKGALEQIDVRALDGIEYASNGSGIVKSLAEQGLDASKGVLFGNVADDAFVPDRYDAKGGISPADTAIYGMVAEGKSAADILKHIAATSRNPLNRQLAKLLQKTGIAPRVTVGDSTGWKMNAGEGHKYAAAYNPATDTVALFRPASAERHVLHELMHAATLKALSKNGLASMQMKALFAHVRKSGALKGMYGMSDVDEFVAEAFSNPKFQEALKKVSAPSSTSGLKSGWHWFVRIVRGILGMPQGQENALSQAIEIGLGVMREDMKVSEAGGDSITRPSADQSKPFGRIDEIAKAFERRIGEALSGGRVTGPILVTENTPASMQAFGWANRKVVINLKELQKIAAKPGFETDKAIASIVHDLRRPALMFWNTKNQSLNYLRPGKMNMMIGVAPDADVRGGTGVAHLVLTAHFMDNSEAQALRNKIERGELVLIYKGREVLGISGLAEKKMPQFSSHLAHENLHARAAVSNETVATGLPNARAIGTRASVKLLREPDLVKWESDNWGSDIRYNVAEDGWSVSDQAKEVVMRLAGRPMLDPADPFAAENARLREQDQSLWSKAKKQLRRYLAPGGLLPQSVFAEKIKRDSEFQAVEFDVRHLIGGLEQAVKADFGMAFDKLSKEQMRPITEALAGNVPASLPEATKTAAVAMRQYIDGMSTEYLKIIQQKIDVKMLKAVESGKDADKAQAINEIELFEKIKGNIGRYVHRSYQAFDDPKWFEKVPAPVLNASRMYLKQGYMESGETDTKAAQMAEVTLHEILKNGTAYDSMESFIAESKLGAKDLSVLMRRKEVPPQIRALLGEYPDARLNFTKSATKMGRLIWNTRFLDRVRDMGMGSFFFEGKDRPPNATTQIAADGSEAYAPLNGLWTFPEIAQAFKDALGKEQMSDLYRAIVRANGLVKYGKTVLAPTTAMRNWQSAMFFSLANGHFDLTQMKKSISAFREQVSQTATGQDLTYLRHLKQLGVVYDTPYAGEMARLMEDARMEELLSSDKGDAVRWFRKANQLAQGFYTFGDDFWKIIGFENEKAGLMKAGLSLQEAEIEAAKRIRDTYPTYSMVGKGVQWLSRFPLAGTFVSFPAEIIRTSGNMLRTVASDLKSDNPKLRELGMKRAAGMVFVSAAFYGLAALSMAMAGVGDDEDEAIRDMAPEWQKNSTFLYLGRDEEGKLRYFDMSFLDPYGYWKRPITAILRNQPWEDSLASGLRGMLEPFLGADITAAAIFEAVANQKESGGKVYKEKDGAIDQAVDIADHLRKALQPGVVGNVERLVKAAGDVRKSSGQPYSMEDELVALAGWRATTIEPKTALYYRSFEFTDSLSEARKTLTDTLRDANDVSPEDIRDAKERADAKQEQAFKEMSRLVGAAEAAGMSKMQIMQTLRLSNISQANIASLMRGATPAVKVTPELASRAVKQAKVMRGDEFAAEVSDRYRLAMTN